ncbi:hypothetical protein E308F_18000 [Moorella sp. E308F]|uniref:DUF927 domain-containing protein n=1 Tax=unclassified Neomoorella TaxID=2676739 RepID=UPI0010FFC507|nr:MULTISPECIES: DUF927 domain-containing protein [unclassified Moorella (in: firmicutes)]GEA15556.1 hypothetical protein E308F_18000 [Moorella sp. E308F]GEA19586.1 hypothetical protein E306M_27240 [Moorella sp. E306M]
MPDYPNNSNPNTGGIETPSNPNTVIRDSGDTPVGAPRRTLPDAIKHKLMTESDIPPALADAAGLYWVTAEEASRMTGVHVESGGIAIPYPGEPDGFVRVRLDRPKGDMKYVSPRRAGCRLYVPPGADMTAPEVVITEGEKKALCAVNNGINCFGVSGIDSWRERSAVGEQLPPDEALLGRLKRDWGGQRVVLVYDSDIDQRHKRWAAFPELAEQLYRLGAKEVKIITLPKLEAVDGKVGLDDYLVAYKRAGEDGAARFRSLVEHAPAWLPVGAGAEAFAARELASGDIERQILGAAALLGLLKSEPVVKARLKRAGIRRYHKDILDGARRVLSQARERQEPRRPPEPEEPEPEPQVKTIAELFPPAAGTPFADFPVPEGWTIDSLGQICTQTFDEETGESEADPVIACVVALAGIMVPADQGEDTIYDLWWYKDGGWNKIQAAGGMLFNVSKAVDFLANLGMPVDSTNIMKVITWLGALRDYTFTHPDHPLPVKILVARSGWHKPQGERIKGEMFAVGRDIFTTAGRVDGEAGETADAPESDHPLSEWSSGIGAGEKQMLAAITARGTLDGQKRTYLKYFEKYPLAAFFTGAGAAGPLIRYLVEEGESDVCGFVVESTDPESGRGKTTLNMFPAGLWGRPTLGDMIRTANRTTVHSEILFSVHCDISAHIDESQLVRYADAVAEIVYSLALGMGKERGAKSGGSRKTRRWYSVLVVSAERSILDVVRGRQGVFDRVLSFPPLFPAKREQFRVEAEQIAKDLAADYGHLGRRYVQWLLSFPEDARRKIIVATYRRWKDALDRVTDRVSPATGNALDGSSEKNQTLKRLAKRAAACGAGLELLLRSLGEDGEKATEITAAALDAAWENVVTNTSGRALLATVLDVLRSFVAENRELIDGLREAEGKPPRWVGKIVRRDGKKYVALYANAVRDALKKNADVEYETAAKALKNAGLVWVPEKMKEKHKNVTSLRFGGGKREWCLLVDAEALLEDDADMWAEEIDLMSENDTGIEDGVEL